MTVGRSSGPVVKICCIGSLEEARLAIAHGAHAIGLVSAMPSGPGPIPDDRIRAIAANVSPPTETFLLTSRTSASDIIAHQRSVGTTAIQIVDRLTSGSHEEIRKALPSVRIVQVVHVLNEQSIQEAVAVSSQVDALLLDSGNPSLEVKELGGTGRIHNWEISRRIRELVPIPVYLAGGLTPGNVREAFEAVRPFGVDVCSGVRTGGKLDPAKLRSFFDALF